MHARIGCKFQRRLALIFHVRVCFAVGGAYHHFNQRFKCRVALRAQDEKPRSCQYRCNAIRLTAGTAVLLINYAELRSLIARGERMRCGKAPVVWGDAARGALENRASAQVDETRASGCGRYVKWRLTWEHQRGCYSSRWGNLTYGLPLLHFDVTIQ
jgi:hypothetical protein